MCGIFVVYNYSGNLSALREHAIQCASKLTHRGPDWSGCCIANNSILCHERLSIVGVENGDQPVANEDKSIVLVANGEIYNYKAIAKHLGVSLTTGSDSEAILRLYERHHGDVHTLARQLDGFFAFALLDVSNNRLIVARDPIGIVPLYQGWNSNQPGTVYFASELKALHDDCDKITAFPPGHIFDSYTDATTRYYNPSWWDSSHIPTRAADLPALRSKLEDAVKKRLMSEVPFGVLLSGGLDSSLIASIAQRLIKEAQEDGITTQYKLRSFAVGLEGSPDLAAAQEVANFLGTDHKAFTFTVQDGIDAIPGVIYHLETYDVTTVRASTPMYLMSRRIKSTGVKMVLSGEGSDEIFGGYLYFHAAPDAASLHQETVSTVKNLSTSDCLRANKSTMAWGLEARVPFLDKAFLEEAMTINPEEKMYATGRMEKYILRKAFDGEGSDKFLPDKILWRQKEQFSDGVGYLWIDTLKATAEAKVSDERFKCAASRWPLDTPQTKEAYWYREIFENLFPNPACLESVVRWQPRADWGCPTDPSGRAQTVHTAAYARTHTHTQRVVKEAKNAQGNVDTVLVEEKVEKKVEKEESVKLELPDKKRVKMVEPAGGAPFFCDLPMKSK